MSWLSAEVSGSQANSISNILALLNAAHAESVHSHSSAAQHGTGMFSLITWGSVQISLTINLDNTPIISVGHISKHQAHYPLAGWKEARLMPPPNIAAGPSIITPHLLNNTTPASSLALLGQLKF